MKKYTLALALVALMPFVSASAYEYGQVQNKYSSSSQVGTKSYKTSGAARKNGGYRNVITNNFYYNQPSQSNYYAPKKSSYGTGDYYNVERKPSYNTGDYYNVDQKKQNKNTARQHSSQERKFFLAHPFFQPLKGNFGSVTDVSYSYNRFNFDVLNGALYDVDPESDGYNTIEPFDIRVMQQPLKGKAETGQVTVKEDFSYGISDTLAVLGMAQYDRTKVSFKDWSDGSGTNSKTDSGLNIFGAGLQERFIDNNKWIGMIAGFFQHQRDIANTFIGDLKIGYKIHRTTVYALGRVGYSDLIKGDMYGMYMDDAEGNYFMLAYKTHVHDMLYTEGGLGAFAVLNKDFTLNAEAIYGHYDWHNQFNLKGAIGWQPGSNFALNLYGLMSVNDTAKGKNRLYLAYEVNPDKTGYPPINQETKAVYTMGDCKINDYVEWRIGIQGIIYF